MMRRNTVQQLLQVFDITRTNVQAGSSVKHAYQQAVHRVAKNHSVTYQTIGDGCRRRLRLDDIRELYAMLLKWLGGNAQPLINQLVNNADPNCLSEIHHFFRHSVVGETSEEPDGQDRHREPTVETFTVQLARQDALLLEMLCEIEGSKPSKLLSEIVRKNVRDRMRPLLQDLVRDSASASAR